MNAGVFRALVTCCLLVPAGVEAGQAGDLLSVQDLKKLDLVQLLKLQVTTVSRHREAASRAAAAVEVIPQQQIERTGAASVPDALRMATGVQVSRFGGHSFAISSRGFTSLAANKLQVMQDGQSLYSPLFSGVFWDAYGVMLEDLDRIEVIRGPGATMWGANAVNGVINIITKDARETQGTLMAGGGGSEERAFGVLRHGGKLGERAFYRMYGRYHGRDDMARSDGGGTHDGSKEGQGGVRFDAGLANEDRLTLQSDYLYSEFDTSLRTKAINRSSNVIGRWTHQFASDSDLQLQTYYRRFERNVPEQFGEERNTYDLDLQGRKLVGGRHDLIGGVNCRLSGDKTKTGGTTEFEPRNKTIGVYSLFLQDEVSLLDRRLALVVGSKFEWQSLDGFEPQPSVRLAWTPSDRQTVWSAFSRAARMPSRIDEDLRLVPAPGSGVVLVEGNSDFKPEIVRAYEAGYRVQPAENLFLDVAGYFNDYDGLRSLEPTPPLGIPFVQYNRLDAETCGVELAVKYQTTTWWRWNASYTYLHKTLLPHADSLDPNRGSLEGNDAPNLASFWSSMDLSREIALDSMLRYVDALPDPRVPAYVELDLRLAWRPEDKVEVSVVGQNLLDERHREYGLASPSAAELERGVYGKLSCQF